MTFVVCDVDGTLVDKDKELTDATVAAVGRLRAAGVGFTIISARPMSGMTWIADRLGCDAAMGAFNGGAVFRRDGTVLTRETIDPDVARGMLALAAGAAVDVWVFADDVWHATRDEGTHVEHERLASNQQPVLRKDFADLADHADKIVMVSDDPALLTGLRDKALQRFAGRATIVQSQTYYLDTTALAANKGDGIAALAAAAGVPLAETIAIGDQANDIAMFERAGHAIAMGNATDAAKAAADDVTTANDADGVAHAIDTFILKGR